MTQLTRGCVPEVLKLSSNVSDVLPKILKLSSEVSECKPVHAGAHDHDAARRNPGRGLHSSTFRLNISVFCGIGGAFRGCLGGV